MSLFDSVVITGGRGMLAKAILEVLHARGISSIALGRDELDLASRGKVAECFEQYHPTLLINCAAHTKVDLCEDEPEKADAINGHAVGYLAAECRKHGTILVHYSTDFVFDGSAQRPYRTDDAVHPLSAYGRSKLLGEQLLQQNPPQRWLILRTAWLYGRGGPSFPRTIIERGRQGHPLKVVDDQIGSPTYTPDLAQATFDLLNGDFAGLWHVTNSGQTSWYEFARAALETFHVQAPISPISTADWLKIRPKQAIRPAYSVLDVEPFSRAIGRPMRPWREALTAFHQNVVQAGEM